MISRENSEIKAKRGLPRQRQKLRVFGSRIDASLGGLSDAGLDELLLRFGLSGRLLPDLLMSTWTLAEL